MVSLQFSAEVRKFCETTSIRGVSRVVKSKSTGLFILWLLGVLTCAGLLIWQITLVFKRYSSYSINTLLVQAPYWKNATFPDITICNVQSLVHQNEMNMAFMNYFEHGTDYVEYGKLVKYAGSKANISESEYMDYVMEVRKSTKAYFNNFPIKDTKNETCSPILPSKYFDWDFVANISAGNIQPVFDPDFYKCYTAKLDDIDREKFQAFSAVIFVDQFFDSTFVKLLNDYNLDISNPGSSGMRVLIHPAGTVPDMKLGLSIAPGSDTTITVTQTAVIHLPYPYSNCTTQKTLGSYDNHTYTVGRCVDVCIQNQLLMKCGCIDSAYQFTDEQAEQSNNTFCGSLELDKSRKVNYNGFLQHRCTKSAGLDYGACHAQCFTPCKELKYSTTVSSSPWPNNLLQKAVYHTYISNHQDCFGSDFNDFVYIYSKDSVASVHRTPPKAIKDYFLQLTVRFDSQTYMEQKDVAAMSLDTLGAQIGGVLSLWLGVTIILIFELCEFFFNLICMCIEARKKKSVGETTTISVQAKM